MFKEKRGIKVLARRCLQKLILVKAKILSLGFPRTPLTVATVSGNKKAIELLLQHGAVFPESNKGFYPCQTSAKMAPNDMCVFYIIVRTTAFSCLC